MTSASVSRRRRLGEHRTLGNQILPHVALGRLDLLDLTLHQCKPFGLASDLGNQYFAERPSIATSSVVARGSVVRVRRPSRNRG